jgi:PQQ-like domain
VAETALGVGNVAKLVPRWSVTLGNVVVSGSLLLAFAERDGAARRQHALAGGVVVVGEKDRFTQGSHGLIEKVDGATGAGLGFVPTSFLAGAVTPPTLAGGDVWFAFDVTVGGGLRASGLQGVRADERTVVDPSAVSPSFASPAVAGGVVYTGDQSGNLAAYDAAGVTGCSDGGAS